MAQNDVLTPLNRTRRAGRKRPWTVDDDDGDEGMGVPCKRMCFARTIADPPASGASMSAAAGGGTAGWTQPYARPGQGGFGGVRKRMRDEVDNRSSKRVKFGDTPSDTFVRGLGEPGPPQDAEEARTRLAEAEGKAASAERARAGMQQLLVALKSRLQEVTAERDAMHERLTETQQAAAEATQRAEDATRAAEDHVLEKEEMRSDLTRLEAMNRMLQARLEYFARELGSRDYGDDGEGGGGGPRWTSVHG